MQIYELFVTLATHTSISISYQLKEANRRDKFAPSKPLLRLPHHQDTEPPEMHATAGHTPHEKKGERSYN